MASELEFRHLRAFVALVTFGSFSRAARELGVSQSTMSESVASLERAIGSRVVERRGRTVSLTQAGRVLLPHARRAGALVADALADLEEHTTEVESTLRIGTNESISTYLLPAPLAALRKRWPRARVRVRTALCTEIREGLDDATLDIGLVLEPASVKSRHGAETLMEGELLMFTAPGHPRANAEVGRADLLRSDFYLSDASGSFVGLLERYFKEAQFPAPRTHSMGSIEGVKRSVMVEHSVIGVLPAVTIDEELRDGRVVRISPMPHLVPVLLRALFVPGYRATPMVAALLELLRG